ncbi:hypothetical protein Erwinia_phage_Farigoule_00076 [Erwinia phage Farigoule]|nr:hypothetical protein Erwinia_phage_Farigoule_00076 [Erwinia phage Farigoule]
MFQVATMCFAPPANAESAKRHTATKLPHELSSNQNQKIHLVGNTF